MKRRSFLAAAAAAGALGSTFTTRSTAAAGDYKALVCVFLTGGNDGHNVLVPTDGAYADYSAARFDLALSKASLAALDGTSAGHTFGLHPSLTPLASLYNQHRLAFIANAGPLIQPVTAQQFLAHTAVVPPYLLSHSDQVAMQQGWGGDIDASGWAGRSLEALPTDLQNRLNAISLDSNRTLVLGRQSRTTFMSPNPNGMRYWGQADLATPSSYWSQAVNRMAQWQFANEYEEEYSNTFGGSVSDSTLITQAQLIVQAPQGNFESDDLAQRLRSIASLMPVFKSQGYRRQVFLVSWGSFDTHTGQRGSGTISQDTQLLALGKALSAFDQSNIASGLGAQVTTLMMSDFGRSLKPASGGGSDHAWGNHWMVMGGSVSGGQVVGQLPSLVLGGVDDLDRAGEGRFAPTIATDQVGATLMQWMGAPSAALPGLFPNLSNFTQSNLGFMQG